MAMPANIDFLDTMARTRLAAADASGIFTDEQLCKTYRLSQHQLDNTRETAIYQQVYGEQISLFQAQSASRYFELQTLGATALKNARHYLEGQDDKAKLDMTKFILTKILPNPEQAVRVSTNSQPHLSVEATVIINERATSYAKSLEGAPVGDIADDPNLITSGRQ